MPRRQSFGIDVTPPVDGSVLKRLLAEQQGFLAALQPQAAAADRPAAELRSSLVRPRSALLPLRRRAPVEPQSLPQPKPECPSISRYSLFTRRRPPSAPARLRTAGGQSGGSAQDGLHQSPARSPPQTRSSPLPEQPQPQPRHSSVPAEPEAQPAAAGSSALLSLLQRVWALVSDRLYQRRAFSVAELRVMRRLHAASEAQSEDMTEELMVQVPSRPKRLGSPSHDTPTVRSPGSPDRERRRTFGSAFKAGGLALDVQQRRSVAGEAPQSPKQGMGERPSSCLSDSAMQRLASGSLRGGEWSCGIDDVVASAYSEDLSFGGRQSPRFRLPDRTESVDRTGLAAQRRLDRATQGIFGGALRQKGIFDKMLQLIADWASATETDLGERAVNFGRSTAELLDAETCDLWFLDASLRRLVARVPRQPDDKVLDVDKDAKSLPCIALRKRQVVSIGRAGSTTQGLDAGDECRELGERCVAQTIAVAPIWQDGDVVGVAELRNKFKWREVGGQRTGDRELLPAFSFDDVRLLEAMATFAGMLHKNSALFQVAVHQRRKAEAMLQLAQKLQSAHLSQHTLVNEIIDGARELTNSDRCSLFIVDDARRELVAYIAGQSRKVRVPLDSGIAGHVALTGGPLNIEDAYQVPMFNTDVDRRTGYRTQTVLAVPVVYERSIVAVAQLINKMEDGGVVPFTQEDEELLSTFATFAGVGLRNCKEHDAMCQALSRNLIIMDASARMGHAMVKGPDEVIHVLISGARSLANADRCSVFLVDKERDELYSTATDSKSTIRFRIGVGIAGSVCRTGQPENIPDAYADPRFNPAIDRKMGYVTRTILCFPIYAEVDGETQVVAVSQLINKLDDVTGEVIPFTRADEDSARDFAKFVGVMIMNNKLYEHTVNVRNETMKLFSRQSFRRQPVDAAGRQSQSISFAQVTDDDLEYWMGLELDEVEINAVKTREFDIHPYRADGERGCKLVPLLVELFKDLGLLTAFSMCEEKLFRFLVSVRSKYRQVPYHNFSHAADVTQTMYCFLKHGKMAELLEPQAVVAVMVAAVVHDIDHMGLNNSFHFKAETPMAILSSVTGSTSVLEVHHCNLTIELLSYPETDIFSGLPPAESKWVYKALIDMILATDMARHKDLCEFARNLWQGGYVRGDAEHQKTLLQFLLKSADISNITKPFYVCEQWAVAVTEEFHQQGDREKETIGHTIAMFDREKAQELARGQVGFIDFMGAPFYSFVGSVFPGLLPWVRQLEANRTEWASQLAAPEG